MPSLNQVTLLGNLTRDPELRVTPKGTAICQFGLAINREFKAETGERREEVTFVDVEVWGKVGEACAKHLSKGRMALVVGRLKLDSWEDKTSGQKRSKMKVVGEQIQFLGAKGEQNPPSETPEGSKTPPPERHQRPPTDGIDEDVPF